MILKRFFSYFSIVPAIAAGAMLLPSCNSDNVIESEPDTPPVEAAPPVISLPLSGDALTLATGSEYLFTPQISNSDSEDFSIEWKLDGAIVGTEREYTFKASQTGVYTLTVTASNADGSDEREISITVTDNPPFTLEFPKVSLLAATTARYTIAGRPVSLMPVIEGIEPEGYTWSVDGQKAGCDGPVFIFTPDTPGDYNVSLSVGPGASASVRVVCVDVDESSLLRKAAASSSPRSTKVFEWLPAPGQFIGETQTGGMSGNESTMELACTWAEKRLTDGSFVSLGAFGGYIIAGFDHSIVGGNGDYDFAVAGNAFLNAASGTGGSNEPGIVYVMQDVNANGLPDDEWYELRGSETGQPTTVSDYAVTYFRPAGEGMNVMWADNRGNTGTVDYLKAFHRQPSYYPAWVESDSYTLRGTCLAPRTQQDATTGMWNNSAYPWGYSDNIGSDCLGGNGSSDGQGQRNGFRISNAMSADGSPVSLGHIDFIKVQTGVNSKSGRLGEVSTEVCGLTDLSM